MRILILPTLAALTLTFIGCDADGDGLDDTTGQPVARAATPPQPAAGGCGPDGWALLCGGDPDVQPEPAAGLDPDLARHEAGHAAAVRALGGTITTCRLYPDGTGRVSWIGLPNTPHARIVVEQAGIVAHAATASQDDHNDIRDALNDVAPADRDRVMAEAHAHAQRIVADRAGEIEQDTAELLETGRCT